MTSWWTTERKRAAGLFAFFFLVIAAFWLQKPIRTSRFLTAVGPQNLPWVKLGTAFLILPVVMLYSAVAARYRRQQLVYLCVGVFVTATLAFWWLFSAEAPTWTHYVYFFYVDIFNSVMVALFWTFTNDLSTPEEAKRWYGFIGAGGILGGAVGSSVTGVAATRLGAPNLLLICSVLLVGIAIVAWLVGQTTVEASSGSAAQERQPTLRDAISGAHLVFSSRYLASIALIVAFYEIVSNVIDYQFNVVIAGRYPDEAAMESFLGLFNSVAILTSLAAQFVLTTWILRKWGPRVGLIVLPSVLALGSAAFLALPIFAAIGACFFSDAALSYSLNQTTKEVLYTPTDSASKYQAKAFIDMFLMRFAKGISAAMLLGWIAWLAPHGWQIHQLGFLSLAVIVAWITIARIAARKFDDFKQSQPESQARIASPSPVVIGCPPKVRRSLA